MDKEQRDAIMDRLIPNDIGWKLERDCCGYGSEYILRCPFCEEITGKILNARAELPHVFVCPSCGREGAAMKPWDYTAEGIYAYALMSPADLRYLQWLTDQGRPASWRGALCL